jgi:ABC-type polysaccharide/polyol phosphate export permease
MTDMVFQGDLIKRIYVPRSVFILSATGTGFVNLLVSILPLLAIAIILGVSINLSILYLLPSITILLLFTLGLSLILTAGAVFFSDLIPLFEVLLRIWFYATPLFYPISIIPEKYLLLFKLNPMYYMVSIFRMPILMGQMPDPKELLIAAIIGFVLLLVGWYFFTNRSNDYAYWA